MATRKEDEIKIPESVLNRANRSILEGSYGITGQERERYNIPRFPSFGFAPSTMLDQEVSPPYARMEEQAVNYSRDAGTRMANRYTMPVSDLGVSDFRSGGFRTQLPTSRVGATAYSDPEMARILELEKSKYINPTQNVGQSGFGREYTFGDKEVQQIVSPYGMAQTNLTPQQVEQRAQARQEAMQKGTMSRTPEEQQALLAQMRQAGASIRESIASTARDSFKNRTPSRLYTTPSGSAIAAPTDMYGRTIKDFENIYARQEKQINDRKQAAASVLASTGFGRMQRNAGMAEPSRGPLAQEPTPFGLRRSPVYAGLGLGSPSLGGPQPAQSSNFASTLTEEQRKRIFGAS